MPSKSKKQAKLMAAVAHNPKFAKKVGIPQSVGREFNNADRVLRKYAEGGKVSQALRFLKLGLKKRDTPVLSNPATAEDAGRMKMLMKELYPGDDWLRTWESENNSVAFPASVGIHEQVLKQLQEAYPDERFTLGLGITLKELEEQLLKKGRFSGHDSTYDPYADTRDFNDTHPGFADGGQVLPSSQDEEESWSDTYIKRPLSGLASMWGSADPETGGFVNPAWHNIKRMWNADERRRQGLPRQEMAIPGIVDEAVSLPALGQIVGLPAPEFATDAEERASATREAARDAIGVDAPHGFAENIAESAGVMAGQVPVPAAWANKLKILKESGKLGKAGKVLGPAVEWFSPTVVPKAGNYIKGTLFGGILGGGLDYAGDYVDEKETEERHKQFISEAVAEVLEEERLKKAEESGDEASDDEALAELGYAEGGKVSIARRALSTLRDSLEEAEDPAVRQAKIDEALRAINTPGTVELPKTIRAGLHAQREPAEMSSLIDQALPLLQPARTESPDLKSLAPGLTAPAPVRSAEELARSTAHGTMADEVLERLMRRVGYHDRGANRSLSQEMSQLDQEDLDWEKMHGYAKGGGVRNYEIPAPQAQKEGISTQTAAIPNAARPEAPLSQEWFENYGAGPEHLFLGDRTIKLHDYWAPQHPGAVPPEQQNPEGSWLPGVGIVGLALYDEWKKNRAEGQDTSQQAFWNDMHSSAASTSDTDAWVNQQLDQYGNSAPMPVMGEDGSVSYVQPSQFWRDMHNSAANTSDTDAWVNSQLENYNAPMPVLNDDGTVSYVNAQGEPVDAQGLNLGRAWQGIGGAYDVYSGLQTGDVQGYTQALQGLNDMYGAYTGTAGFGGAAGTGVGTLSGLSSIYSGVEEGGVRGYSQAAGGVSQTAQQLGYNNGATSALGTAASVVGAAYNAYGAYESAKVGDKKGAVAQGAAAGAAIGSVIPVIGTAIGAVVGAVVGLIGASLGDKEQASEAYYKAHKNLKTDAQIRGWGEDQVNGAVFETIKSHTKSGNVNKFKDVGEMYTAFGITKDAHKNYKNVQGQMGNFIKGVIETAQQMGALPTDPTALRQLDGQKIYYEVVVPAMAAKFKEATGKESTAWNKDSINASKEGAKMQNLFADWTDWMTSHWGEAEARKQQQAEAASQGGFGVGEGQYLQYAQGGRVTNFRDNPRAGALVVLQ